jgi:serine/threonine-protein kinase
MAKKKQPAESAAADEFPSSAVLAELKSLVKVRDAQKRSLQAWHLILKASANSDFPVVMDFAQENSLVLALDGAGKQLEDGQRVVSVTWVNPIDGSEMIWIPPGRFYVGPDKAPAECAGFSLARYPVTNAQFTQFVEATNYQPPEGHPDPELFTSHWKKGKPAAGQVDHPVVYVSYIDALHYCLWAGMQLPTEWQWEKGARGPDGRIFPWGAEPPSSRNKLAHVQTAATTPVGKFSRVRTPYGCEDMIGNVSEWCHTGTEGEYSTVPPALSEESALLTDFEGLTMVRGSCFMRNEPKLMQSSHRRRLSKIRRNYWTGFRPAFQHSWCPAQG